MQEAPNAFATGNEASCAPQDSREGNPMGLFFSAFVGGLLGTGFMDIAELLMRRLRVTSGSG